MRKRGIGKTIELSKYVIDAIADAVVKKMQEPVLDKIRAEIEALEEGITSYHNDRPWIFKDEALQIIDKYRKGEEE